MKNKTQRVVISSSQRNEELESKFGIILGKPHRIIIAGANPCYRLAYYGLLERIGIYPIEDQFATAFIELREG